MVNFQRGVFTAVIWVIRGGQHEDAVEESLRTNAVGIEYWTDGLDLSECDFNGLKEQIACNYGQHMLPFTSPAQFKRPIWVSECLLVSEKNLYWPQN